MTQTSFEEQSIEMAYLVGEISYEEYCKLMNDITLILWSEL